MRTWENLRDLLKDLFNCDHVYYQPPNNLTMLYPAIRFSINTIDSKYANNKRYAGFNCYDIVVISKETDEPVIQKILDLPYASFDRHYISDGLNHDIIKLYY